MAEWMFWSYDNGGKRQVFTVKARTKTEAIEKGFAKAKKNATGDITSWDCRLINRMY